MLKNLRGETRQFMEYNTKNENVFQFSSSFYDRRAVEFLTEFPGFLNLYNFYRSIPCDGFWSLDNK